MLSEYDILINYVYNFVSFAPLVQVIYISFSLKKKLYA
jgi:hypothetical protein